MRLHGGSFICVQKAEQWEVFTFVHSGPECRTGHGMCNKCQELEKKIERLRRLAASINDQLTIDSINHLIKKTEAKKAALHPEQQKG